MTITARHYTFAEWLGRLIEELHMKPIQFAEVSNISRSSISRYLSGERIPKAAKQEHLVKAICRISDFDEMELGHKMRFYCHISALARLKKSPEVKEH